MADCYEFIINHYNEGDRIYLIGFSRGAYTVRCLANTIMLCGIPTKAENRPLLRYRKQVHDIAREAVERVYEHGAGHARADMRKNATNRPGDFVRSTAQISSARILTRIGQTRRPVLLACSIRLRRLVRAAFVGF
jgi:hypothetical protein